MMYVIAVCASGGEEEEEKGSVWWRKNVCIRKNGEVAKQKSVDVGVSSRKNWCGAWV